MTIQEFLNHLRHPETVEVGDTATFRDLAERFPYCTSSQILLAYRLYKDNDLDFPSQLKKVAAYASSRKKLKQLFDAFQSSPERSEEQVEIVSAPEQASPVTEELPETRIEPVPELTIDHPDHTTVPEIDRLHPNPLPEEKTHEEELLAIVRQRLAEIKLEREKERAEQEQETVSGSSETDKTGMTKGELIDKFIHDKPRLSPPKATFFSPSEKAIKSNLDDEEIVTETLARLYYKQGNIGKARKIYDKLILLFPEKSSYFAAQIEKMTSPPSQPPKENKD